MKSDNSVALLNIKIGISLASCDHDSMKGSHIKILKLEGNMSDICA